MILLTKQCPKCGYSLKEKRAIGFGAKSQYLACTYCNYDTSKADIYIPPTVKKKEKP